jgi:hypothetical protein
MSTLHRSVKTVLNDHIMKLDDEFDSLMQQRSARNDELDRIGEQLNLIRKVRAEYSDALDLLAEATGEAGR